ncbi:FtsW/RodA/SpoVE family cell cycle protein [Paenibacillus barengoltzii]|uniref:FtsW/RodA/SpoVE family cell cycle protein n=1 Tax=Paenibacillus barengoltzii TaxID=343517 RepID=UPI002FD977D2
MLGFLGLMLTLALLAMYAVQLGYQDGLFVRQAIYMASGLVVMFFISRVHHQRLYRHSWMIFGLSTALILAAQFWGSQINGARSYIFGGISVTALCPYLFIIAAAGLLSRVEKYEGYGKVVGKIILLGVLPLLLFVSIPSSASLLLYAATFAFMLAISRYARPWAAAYLAFVAAAFLLPLLLSERVQDRLLGFLLRQRDPNGAGYLYRQIDEAVRSAGWNGHGFGSPMKTLPYIHSDHIFTYLIYSMGWTFGIIITLLILFFILQLTRMFKSVKDPYGKMLISGIGALLVIQFLWSMGMSLGFLPLSAVPFPFLSYGMDQMLVQLAAIGLIYSVYRRKDMISLKGGIPNN